MTSAGRSHQAVGASRRLGAFLIALATAACGPGDIDPDDDDGGVPEPEECDGALAPELIADAMERVSGFAVTADSLFVSRQHYVSDDGGAFRIPLDGGDRELLLPDGWIYDLETDGTDVY